MSAAEIIEQIKALSPEERQQVASFIHATEQEESSQGPGVRCADDAKFEAVVERVFEKHAELFKKLAE
jgi:hypothetical protein